MADETPQQQTPTPEGEGAETAAPEQSGGRGGPLATYLPLIIAVVVMPLLAWATLEFKSPKSDSSSTESEGEESSHEPAAEPSHGESGEGDVTLSRRADTGALTVPVPLTREPVTFKRKDPKVNNDYDKIVILDLKGEPRDLAQPEKIVVNIANTGGTRFAVARLSMSGRNQDLVQAVNEKREKLFDVATGALASKTLDDINKPGFRNLLRAELLTLFNQALYPYPNLIEEVIITEFVTQ